MKYIVIKRVLKKQCPPGIKSFWSYDKIPSGLWEIWEEREIEESITPEIYTDQMEETIENYSRNYPEYFWDWCTETRGNVHYDILIDGNPYEGNENLETALGLFRSVDDTCLREYYGHTKTLQVTDGKQVITLKEAIIDKPNTRVRIYYQDGNERETEIKLFPEEAVSYFKEGGKVSKIEILNSEDEVICEY